LPTDAKRNRYLVTGTVRARDDALEMADSAGRASLIGLMNWYAAYKAGEANGHSSPCCRGLSDFHIDKECPRIQIYLDSNIMQRPR